MITSSSIDLFHPQTPEEPATSQARLQNDCYIDTSSDTTYCSLVATQMMQVSVGVLNVAARCLHLVTCSSLLQVNIAPILPDKGSPST